MKLLKTLFLLSITIIIQSCSNNKSESYLQKSVKTQVTILQEKSIKITYKEKLNSLRHSFEPWQKSVTNLTGSIWNSQAVFSKQDAQTSRGKEYISKTVFSNNELLFLDFGDTKQATITKKMVEKYLLKTIRYTPIQILTYFNQHRIPQTEKENQKYAIYQTTIANQIVTIYIDKEDYLVKKATILSDDERFGDVLSTIHFNEYIIIENVPHPKEVLIDKINGKLHDNVAIETITIVEKPLNLLEKSSDYKIVEETPVKTNFNVQKYAKNIHFINLKHTEDRVLVVEFKDFLVVAETPLTSENGELIITEAKKIAPNKPIKYFVAGHYHPHYLGGVRAFIHKGAQIICSNVTKDYIGYIANAKRTLHPDSLHIEPKPLLIKEIKDKLSISDGDFEMKIFFIGEKSEHTKGYLIYYFPSEKLVFQDDLIWIKDDNKVRKAGRRQAGLYNAIKELNIDVTTVIQSWPVADYGVKTIIPFKELEASMNIK